MSKNAQLALIDGQALTEQDVMSSIDDVLYELRRTNDMTKVIAVVNIMDKIGRVSGIAKAKLLWGWRGWWDETGQAEKRNDEFVDMVESETGTRPITTKRYILTWNYIEDLTIPKEVQSRPMDDLVKIAITLDHDYDITKDHWKKIAKAANSADVREILREIKGKPPRKSSSQRVLDRNGSLYIYKDGNRHFVGALEVSSNDEVVQKFIRQLVETMQIQEK